MNNITATDSLEVYGARVHNLKNIDVTIPHNSLCVITGLSGCGKSSLAFDTIFAEGQRRYIETFSSYARNMLGSLERPDVDKITGLNPVISIEQKTVNKNPRSTIGTTTEIYDFFRLLFARLGEARSYISGKPMVKYSKDKIVSLLLDNYDDRKIQILAPIVKNRKGHYKELFETLEKKLGKLDIIAEDLGFVTNSVRELLDAAGFPGMKVLQLAFDERESANYLPYTHTRNCVVYTGTHDNNTTRGWYNDIDEACKMFIRDYINKPDIIEENISWNMISLAMSSVAELCIIPMQDYLNLGSSARINTPSVLGNNWEWRLTKNSIGDRILDRIRNLAVTYGRVNLK